MTTTNTTRAVGVNESKLYLFFVRLAKNIFCVCCRILVISLCSIRWKRLKTAALHQPSQYKTVWLLLHFHCPNLMQVSPVATTKPEVLGGKFWKIYFGLASSAALLGSIFVLYYFIFLAELIFKSPHIQILSLGVWIANPLSMAEMMKKISYMITSEWLEFCDFSNLIILDKIPCDVHFSSRLECL